MYIYIYVCVCVCVTAFIPLCKVIVRQFAVRKVLFQLRVYRLYTKTISTWREEGLALRAIITTEFVRDEICLTGGSRDTRGEIIPLLERDRRHSSVLRPRR